MATVDLQNIRKSFQSSEILRGIDLSIRDQELTVFVGPSGCGKSTLLRIIAGLEEVNSGDVLIEGERVNDVPAAKRGIALVFQSYALYPHMSVAENMSFSLKLAGVPKLDREAKVTEAARILHIESLLHRKPKELSGGQRQRVAIGRAIVRNPRVFLFDEPLSNLDAALRVRMRLELVRLQRQMHATMIYVTHDQVEAMTMADSIVAMQGGIIEQVGSPMELYHNPRNLFVAGFLGSPRINLLPATIEQASERATTLRLNDATLITIGRHLPGASANDSVTLGVRPEHLRISSTGPLGATVQTVEQLGSESYVHLLTGSEQAVTVRVNGESNAAFDQQVNLDFDSNFLYLFNSSGVAFPRAIQSQ